MRRSPAFIRTRIIEGVIEIYDTSVGAKVRSYVPDSAPKRYFACTSVRHLKLVRQKA